MIDNSSSKDYQDQLHMKRSKFSSRSKRTNLLAGAVLFLIMIAGAVVAMQLSSTKQDTRNQASVAQGLVKIHLEQTEKCSNGTTCRAAVYVNTQSANIDGLQMRIKPSDLASLASNLSFVENKVLRDEGFSRDKKPPVTTQPTVSSSAEQKQVVGGICLVKGQTLDGKNAVNSGVNRVCNTNADCPANQICVKKTMAPQPRTEQGGSLMVDRAVEPPVSEAVENNITSKVGYKNSTLGLVKNDSSEAGLLLAWTITNADAPFNSNGDFLLGYVTFQTKAVIPNSVADLTLHFDPSFSKATIYKTGEDSLNTPSSLTMQIMRSPMVEPPITVEPTDGKVVPCRTNADCSDKEICFQPPMPACKDGMTCSQVMPHSYCKLKAEFDNGKVSMPPITVTSAAGLTVSMPPVTATPTPSIRVSMPPVTATPTILVGGIPPKVCKASIPKCNDGFLVVRHPNSANACPIYSCEPAKTCEFQYSNWSNCQSGVQTRTITQRPYSGCVMPPTELSRSCTIECKSNKDCSSGESCQLTKDGTNQCQIAGKIKTDLNDDGLVNILDLSLVIKHLFTNTIKADVNGDKVVDIIDYSLVLKDIQTRLKALFY